MPRVELEHVAPIRASVTDAVEELLDELPEAGPISFRRLTGGLVEKLEVVVRFLAVLELYKHGLVELDQAGDVRRARRHLDRWRPRRRATAGPGCGRSPASTPTTDERAT